MPRRGYNGSKHREGVSALVFLRNDRVGLAFTVERGRSESILLREDAEEYAMRELAKAGVEASGVMIEAFECQAGWLIFCTAEFQREWTVYIRFDTADDFLDAVSVHGTDGIGLRGWRSNSGYIAEVTGMRDRAAAYITRMSEYGSPFDAPAGYAVHLEEQHTG
jgi:hypothetical protein